jgi:hypothetical protein
MAKLKVAAYISLPKGKEAPIAKGAVS